MEFGTEGQLTATVPLRDLEEWASIRARLEAAPEVKTVELSEISRAEALIRVNYFGDTSRLVLALGQRDLELREEEGFWFLTLRDGARP